MPMNTNANQSQQSTADSNTLANGQTAPDAAAIAASEQAAAAAQRSGPASASGSSTSSANGSSVASSKGAGAKGDSKESDAHRGWLARSKAMFGGKREGAYVPRRKHLTGHIFALLGISALMLLLANTFYQIEGERRYSADVFIGDITDNWAEEQTVGDPMIAVPSQFEKIWLEGDSENYKEVPKTGSAILLANVTKTDSAVLVDAEERSNGPFKATLYTAHVKQQGYMELDATVLSYLESDGHRTNDVYLLFYVDDNRAIDHINHVIVNGVEREPMSLRPFKGFVVRIDRKEFLKLQYYHPVQRLNFDADYVVRGSEMLTYKTGSRYSSFELRGTGAFPSGKEEPFGLVPKIYKTSEAPSASTVKVAGPGSWIGKRPDSKGPAIENRAATELFKGVETDYLMRANTTNLITYHHFNNSLFDFHTDSREYEQYSYDSESRTIRSMLEFPDGIKLNFTQVHMGTLYSIFTTFSLYSILMLMLLYVALLAVEIGSKRMIARMQYFICGMSVIIFYVLMLSIAEYIGFFPGYLIAALICSTMAGIYIGSAIDSAKLGLVVMFTQIVGHALVYTIIVITGFGLLISTILLVIMLGVIMYITRKINRPDA